MCSGIQSIRDSAKQCKYILLRGARKGMLCNTHISKNSEYCLKHEHYFNIESIMLAKLSLIRERNRRTGLSEDSGEDGETDVDDANVVYNDTSDSSSSSSDSDDGQGDFDSGRYSQNLI